MTRVLLADDHTMVRQSMRRFLEGEGMDIVAEAGDGEEAVRMTGEHRPEVVLMDVSMPVLGGIEATKAIKDAHPEVQVVMLTMHVDADVIRRAVDAGAVGYLTKDCSLDEIATAVRLAADGQTALSTELAAALLTATKRLTATEEAAISPREIEVLELIADGCSTPEVAQKLYISQKTVKNHLSSIYEKLDARDRTQAVLKAVRMGIIRLE